MNIEMLLEYVMINNDIKKLFGSVLWMSFEFQIYNMKGESKRKSRQRSFSLRQLSRFYEHNPPPHSLLLQNSFFPQLAEKIFKWVAS